MKRTLHPDLLHEIAVRLEQAHNSFQKRYPGSTGARQPVHTVYGGAHLFRADTAKRLGKTALRSLDEFAPDFVTFAKVLALPGADRLPESSESAAAIAKSIESDPEADRKENQPAVYSFFFSGLDSAAQRLHKFIEKAAQATLVGEVFDDAATGQGLLNYFLRAINCGAITVDEAQSLTSFTPPGAMQRVVREDSRWPQEIGASIIPCEESLRSTRGVHRLEERLHRDCPSRKAQDSRE